MTIRPLVICTLLVTVPAGVAHAKEYSADRFDSRVEVPRGGALRVTETVLIRFVDGTFTQFYREIPSRRTDGLKIISASMDGTLLPAGDEPGHVQIRQSSRTRVTWHFTRVSGSSHPLRAHLHRPRRRPPGRRRRRGRLAGAPESARVSRRFERD